MVTALPEFQDEPVRIASFGREAREGMVRVRVRHPSERVARALKGWLGCWALSAITLFIPIAHFVLVPGFFVAGIVLGVRWSRETRSFVQAHGPCPGCGAQQTFRLRGKYALPKETSCPACRARVFLQPHG